VAPPLDIALVVRISFSFPCPGFSQYRVTPHLSSSLLPSTYCLGNSTSFAPPFPDNAACGTREDGAIRTSQAGSFLAATSRLRLSPRFQPCNPKSNNRRPQIREVDSGYRDLLPKFPGFFSSFRTLEGLRDALEGPQRMFTYCRQLTTAVWQSFFYNRSQPPSDPWPRSMRLPEE